MGTVCDPCMRSLAEYYARREKRICWRCDEKFTDADLMEEYCENCREVRAEWLAEEEAADAEVSA